MNRTDNWIKNDKVSNQSTYTKKPQPCVYLIKWSVLSVVAGLTGATVVQLFLTLLSIIQYGTAFWGLPQPLWVLCGAAIVGGIIYKMYPDSAVEAMPSTISGIKNDTLHPSTTLCKFWATLITLGTFGSGGIVGPLGRVSTGLISLAGKKLAAVWGIFDHEDQRTASICGLAAAIGAIFQSPIGGGIFAVEVLHRTRIEYKNILPGILASTASVVISKLCGWSGFFSVNSSDNFMDISAFGWLLVLVFLASISGAMFTRLYKKISDLFAHFQSNVISKAMIGSFFAASIGWVINPELLGTSQAIGEALFDNQSRIIIAGRLGETLPFGATLLVMAVVKMVITCITAGSGMSVGFVGPSALFGMLLGAAVSYMLGIEIGSATYFAFIAAGFSAMVASVINVPLAAAVITAEIFGLHYSLPAGLGAVIGFQINRTQTFYDFALKTKVQFTGIVKSVNAKMPYGKEHNDM